ncbi:MAG TPA: hypothetical protein PLP27_11940 [Crocinitomicaceae bacterium]|nr:hypothetical protein [Crocinitomicaceae bacterium]
MRILLICFLFISQISFGQDGFGKIKGHLNYGNKPAGHFFVELMNEKNQTVKQAYTYNDGTFYFDSIAPDFYWIIAIIPDSLALPNKFCIKTPDLIESIEITTNFTHFINYTLIDKRITREDIQIFPPRTVPPLPPYLIDYDGRFNNHISREDIIQRP